ncbi:MAG: GNAT family N-acetyltransferase [Chlorobi bacterium]|nr:GNAT family N-acetyltransferase [Chlorobiota bacterium]
MKISDLKIRDYKAADFAEVNNLWVATGMGGAERGDDNVVIQRTIKAGGKLIILEHNPTEEIIGTSWLTHDNRRVYLHHFGIRPDYQGKGLSKILFNESIYFAKSLGMQIKLEVHKTNLKATELYKKGGFQYLGDYRVYIIRDLEQVEHFEFEERNKKE